TSGRRRLRRGAKQLRKRIRCHRRKAQRGVVRCAERFAGKRLTHAHECLLTGVEILGAVPGSNGSRDACGLRTGDLARKILLRLIAEVREAGDADLSRLERLHDLRIAIKRLRYAVEIFAPCLPAEVKSSLYPQLSDLQSQLGDLNDAHELATRIEALLACRKRGGRVSGRRRREALRAVLEHFHTRRDELRRDFVARWNEGRANDVLRRIAECVESLSRPAASAPWASASGGGFYATHRMSELAAFQRASQGARVAAIDIGTNSIRLIVAEADERTRYRIIEDLKETTRLGSGLYFTGRLGFQAIRRSLRALERMKRIAQQHRVARIRTAATAAVREASNGAAFAELVRRRVNLSLETIDAEQEARLAHASVAHAFDIDDQRVAVVDIGGGSTEVALSAHGFVDALAKLPLGAVYLTEAYCGPDPLGMYRFDEMVAAIDDTLERNLTESFREPEAIIGTGGTFTTLAKVSLRRGLFGSRDG
ncbi:MAG: CHAD domain-containing protein, partial [Planctomycetota bacterium]